MEQHPRLRAAREFLIREQTPGEGLAHQALIQAKKEYSSE